MPLPIAFSRNSCTVSVHAVMFLAYKTPPYWGRKAGSPKKEVFYCKASDVMLRPCKNRELNVIGQPDEVFAVAADADNQVFMVLGMLTGIEHILA